MDVPGFARALIDKNVDSEVWWDSSPTAYASFKSKMIQKYPDMFDFIESLLPDHFAKSPYGISGATTNPKLITEAILNHPRHWRDFVAQLPVGLSRAEKMRQLYDQMVAQGAGALRPLWISSKQRHGWLSAQIDGGEQMEERALVNRGLQLAGLAPNIMIKVPGSEQGYRAIEKLVARGCSINNTFCFTVSQCLACLKAIHNGLLRAQAQGVNTERAVYAITFMIGRLGAEEAFGQQALQRHLSLSAKDRRWAEIAVYQAMQALIRHRQTRARLLLCSLKIDTDARGREHCWHLQCTGADTTVYTLTPNIIEFLIQRQQQLRPITPANGWVQTPDRVLEKLLAIPYFKDAYFKGELAPSKFASHPAFVTASRDAREAQSRLLAFVNRASRWTDNRPIRSAPQSVFGEWV